MQSLTRITRWLVAISLATLLFGLLMPADWTAVAARALDVPVQAKGWFHTGMFAVLFALIPAAAPRLTAWQLLVLAASLAIGTEAMQIFAIGRDPSWTGVRQDLTGALIGCMLGMLVRRTMIAKVARES